MFVGRCCACTPKGDINGFWVRPGKVLLTNLSDLGTESVGWTVNTAGSPPYTINYKLNTDLSTWAIGESRLAYGIRLDSYTPTAENEAYDHMANPGGAFASQYPFAQGRDDYSERIHPSEVYWGGFGRLALHAEKRDSAHPYLNVEEGLITHILHPQIVDEATYAGFSYRLAYYRVLHNGVAVTDILQAFDDSEEFLHIKPSVVTGGTAVPTTTPQFRHTRIDEIGTASDSSYVHTNNNSTTGFGIRFDPTAYPVAGITGHKITVRICECRSGVLTTASDTPSGVTVAIKLRGYQGNNITLTTLTVPVVPTTHEITITASQFAALRFQNRIFSWGATNGFQVDIVPTAVSGAGVAVTQLYVSVQRSWLFRRDTNTNVTYDGPGTGAWNTPKLDMFNTKTSLPNAWQIPEYLRQYRFKRNVHVSVDLWFDIVKRDTTHNTIYFGNNENSASIKDAPAAVGGIGFGVNYISRFDKTKNTWKVTFHGGTWRPAMAVYDDGNAMKFSNYPITVDSLYGDMEDSFCIASSSNQLLGEATVSRSHFAALYWNAEVPVFILSGDYTSFGYAEESIQYFPEGEGVSVTKSRDASPFLWQRDNNPSGYWNPKVPTIFKQHRGVSYDIRATPTFPSVDSLGWPDYVTVEQVPAKRVIVRFYSYSTALGGVFGWRSPVSLLGVTQVLVECWGAGGAFGRESGSSFGHNAGGGGGGGAYSRSLVTIDPDTSYTIYVGQPGQVSGSLGVDGTDGGDTTFQLSSTVLVKAAGGKGGKGGVFGTPGAGGAGGLASAGIGTVKYSGGNGTAGHPTTPTLIGGGGSSGGWEADGNTPTAIDTGAVAVKHGSGYKDADGFGLGGRSIQSGQGAGTTVGQSYNAGSGMVRISYEYENIDIVERRFNTTTKWVAPEGVTTVNVQCWAAGGGSGGTDGLSGSASGGGGGGAYVWKTVTVVPLTEYDVNVGLGGEGGYVDGSTVVNGGDGGDSWFINSSTVKAAGGKGGMSATLDDDEAGGAGGLTSDSIGEEKWSGGDGEDGLSTSYGGGGGSSAANGSDGNPGAGGIGGVPPARGGSGGNEFQDGRFPGGGAGGVRGQAGSSDTPPESGKQGAGGSIILQYAV